MLTIFADTFYWIALTSAKDQWHEHAKQLSASLTGAQLVTTEEVLAEFMTWFAPSGVGGRAHAAAAVQHILSDPAVQVVPQTHASFLAGLTLYRNRLDKDYSMTDCISMHTMRSLAITDVLTHDIHFAQEGFQVLFAARS